MTRSEFVAVCTAVDHEADSMALRLIERHGVERAQEIASAKHRQHEGLDPWQEVFWGHVIDSVERFGS